jgi:hypothetical protein
MKRDWIVEHIEKYPLIFDTASMDWNGTMVMFDGLDRDESVKLIQEMKDWLDDLRGYVHNA